MLAYVKFIKLSNMREFFCCINVLILSILPIKFYGQKENSDKVDISVGSGLSIPCNSYSNNNPLKSAIYVNATEVKGFSKEKSGFAALGTSYILQIKYNTNTHFKILLISGTFSNSVVTNGMSEFLTQLNNLETKVEEKKYKYFFINPGVGYYNTYGKFEIGLNIFLGYANTSFPYYKFVFLSPPSSVPDIFAHNGPTPNLNAITYGSSVSANYFLSQRLQVGINMAYQRADFNYSVSPELIPGGGGANLTFSDILKVKVLNLGLMIAYCF